MQVRVWLDLAEIYSRNNNIMANSDLIKGAGFVGKSEGFVNYAEAINVPNPVQGENFYIKERERKQATKSRVNGYIDNLKSDIDLDGLSPEQTSAMRGFLVSQRSIYANAANEIAKIDDASSPEYQHYVDIMNGVNRGFVNLSEEVKAYKEAKVSYAETHKADLYSNAASGSEIQAAASLYGLDPEVPANFTVADGGHIMFEVDGVAQSYKDYKEPMMKDYKTMNSLLETTNQIFNTGQKLDGTKAQLLGTQVEAMLANPDTIKSILAGDFAGSGIDLSGIAYNPEDVAGTRMQVKDAIMGALTQVANEGYAEKERKRKERNNPNNLSSTQEFDTLTSDFDNHYAIQGKGDYSFVWNEKEGGYIYQDEDGIPHSSVMMGERVVPLTEVDQIAALKGVKRN